jgi:phage recombination protein Bet
MSNLAVVDNDLSTHSNWWNEPEKIELLKRTYAKGCTDDEFELFLAVSSQSGLNPFARQIYAIKRYDFQTKSEVMTPQVSIEGLRLTAERNSNYEGQTAPQWCGSDGNWKDIWLEREPPSGARVGIYRKDRRDPIWGVVLFREVCQKKRGGELTKFWKDSPANQLSKCAEAAAIRRAFPQHAGKLYIAEEMPPVEVEVEELDDANKWVDAGSQEKSRQYYYIQTTEKIKCLGWSEDYARDFLEGFYKKRSRKDLTDKELMEFDSLLDGQIEAMEAAKAEPNPSEEIAA